MKKLIKKIAEADRDFALIEENDVIAVGISGGKDSSLLLIALELYRRKSRKNFKLVGIHINLGFGEGDMTALKAIFDSYQLEVHFIQRLEKILEKNIIKDAVQCSLCSKLKKGAVIQEAKVHHCNKVAFAHHADDAIETLFLNAMYGSRLATFDPKMWMSEQEVFFIRPFVYVKEEEIIFHTQELDIPKVKSGCPVDGLTKRQTIKDILNGIYQEIPDAHDNFIRMLSNQKQLHLWKRLLDSDTEQKYNHIEQKNRGSDADK